MMRCPHCRRSLGASEDITPGANPRPGRPNDLGLCGGCGGWFKFDYRMIARPLTAEEAATEPVMQRQRARSEPGIDMKPAPCPKCGYVMDRAAEPGARVKVQPQPGDITICAGCAAILTFNPDYSVREVSEPEFSKLSHRIRANVQATQEGIMTVRRQHPWKRPS